MSGIAGSNVVVQVGFVFRDIYETKKRWAQFLVVEEPPVGDSGEYAVTHTQYKGEDAPEAKSLLAFFNFPGFQIELIQPNEAPSTWREFLDTHGEGIHHLAFNVGGMRMEQAIENCRDFGMTLEQKGEYADGSGRYAYLSAQKDLKTAIELLENDLKEE